MITAWATDTASGASSHVPVPWWSFSKTILASAALMLVAQGQLELDTPLPGHAFTLRQLLQHRAGLPEYGSLASYHAAIQAGEPPWTPDDMLHRVCATTLLFPPGQGWHYSNVGYYYVRHIIEQATNDTLINALRRLVFGPLGLTGVTLAETPTDLDNTAWGATHGYHPGWVYHGLLVGPAQTAALLLHRLLAGALLPSPLLQAMLTLHLVTGPIPGRPWATGAYGLGLMIGETVDCIKYTGHTGMGPNSACAVYTSGHRTAARFSATDDQGLVETRVVQNLHNGTISM